MKAVKLSGSVRKSVGKTGASSVRATGMVPGVIYGGEKQISVQIKENDMNKIFFTPKISQFKLDIDGTEYSAILQEVQQHPVTDRIIHFDFLELTGKPVKMRIPVKLKGNSIGVRNGGKLSAPNRTIMIQGIPDDFPEEIVVDIENLKIGETIKVGDINEPGIKILAKDESTLASVKMSRGAILGEEEEEEEEGAEGTEGEAPAEGAAPEAK